MAGWAIGERLFLFLFELTDPFFLCAGWIADRFGRRKGVALGSVFALLGSALMSGSVNSDMVS